MRKVGDRVGAILCGKDNVVQFLGFGVYAGETVPDEAAAGWMAKALRDTGISNPKLELDNGQVVWGCECWWGGEVGIQKKLDDWKAAGWEIVNVDIADSRREDAAAEELAKS